jgi:hypothetical protein
VPPLTRSVPVRLDIPAIGVQTSVVPVGLNDDGTVAVPPLARDAPAGWYDHLASPGEPGPAVILGHVDSALDGPAVFYRLGTLPRGATVFVRRADGSTAAFTVTAVGEYPKSAFPSRAVYGPAAGPVLRIITCGGDFDHATGTYRDNIVAFATYTSSIPLGR